MNPLFQSRLTCQLFPTSYLLWWTADGMEQYVHVSVWCQALCIDYALRLNLDVRIIHNKDKMDLGVCQFVHCGRHKVCTFVKSSAKIKMWFSGQKWCNGIEINITQNIVQTPRSIWQTRPVCKSLFNELSCIANYLWNPWSPRLFHQIHIVVVS